MRLSGKRLLWVTREFPSSRLRGDFYYSHGIMAAMAAQGVSIHAVGRVGTSGIPSSQFSNFIAENGIVWTLLPSSTRTRIGSIFSLLPSDSYRLATPDMTDVVRRLSTQKSFDWIVLDIGAQGWVVDRLRDVLDDPKLKLLYLSHNNEKSTRAEVATRTSTFASRLALRYDAFKYGCMESRILRRASIVSAITIEDADAFKKTFPNLSVVQVSPGYDGIRNLNSDITCDTPRRAVLLGSFEWTAKRESLIQFARAAAPVLRRAHVQITIIGSVQKSLVSKIRSISDQFDFVGFQSDLSAVLRHARIGIVAEPFGGGFKLKLLDYIFHGLPVASLFDCLNGLPTNARKYIVAAPDYASLATSLVEAIDDINLLNINRRELFRLCAADFSWPQSASRLIGAMDSAACEGAHDEGISTTVTGYR